MIVKRGLVLAGGGVKGAYECGAIQALDELGVTFDVVTGTSIGSLNGCLVAQKDNDKLYELWKTIKMEDILADALPNHLDIESLVNSNNLISTFFKKYVKEKGADITPFKDNIDKYYDYDRLKNSGIKFGLVTVSYPSLKPLFMNSDKMDENSGVYLLASSSCFPAFPICKIDNKSYIDGGYYDNLPIDLALELGAEEIVAIDLRNEPQHPHYLHNANVKYIYPKEDLGFILNFDREMIDKNMCLGYLDCMKAFDKYKGVKYTFELFEDETFFKKVYVKLQYLGSIINADTVRLKKSFVFDVLMEQQYKKVLSYDDVAFGMIDNFMELFGYDSKEVYNYERVLEELYANVADSFSVDYKLVKGNVVELVDELKELDKVSIVKLIIHQVVYKDNPLVSDKLIMTIAPFERAMAEFMIVLKDEKGW